LQAGDLIILQVTVRDYTNIPATPARFTFLCFELAVSGIQYIYYKFSDGTESGTLTITIGGNTCHMGRMYAFRNAVSTEAISSVSGQGATIWSQPVTTSGKNELAVCLVYVCDDNDVGSFTGETGGDWTETVPEFKTTAGLDGCIQIQTASMPSPGTLTQGSYTMTAADPWTVLVLALRGREFT